MQATRKSTYAETIYVTTSEPWLMTAKQDETFYAFHEWYQNLLLSVHEIGIEECGLAPMSPLTLQYVEFIAVRTLVEGGTLGEMLVDWFSKMPAIPYVWPDKWDVQAVLKKLDDLVDGRAEFPLALFPALAQDVRQQAVKLEELAANIEGEAASQRETTSALA